ncbi:MAG: ABC transporter ATP-binding protein [Casimicrobiaceae bacterium]
MALFEARGLHKRFGDRVVLEEIDLAFEPGTLTGIMGPNGAGKTTCFNCLTGLYAPDRGRILFDGADLAGLPPPAITRLGVARSFQAMNLFNDDSALDNVVFALPQIRARSFDAWRDRARDRDARERAAAVLERVGLRGRERIRARDLAYGERRALEIGLALATDPRILFLDEPTSGLGADGIARLRDLVAELKRQLTLVIIEHDMGFLFGLADRINVIHWGQVIARGTPGELRGNPWVQRSALGAVAC